MIRKTRFFLVVFFSWLFLLQAAFSAISDFDGAVKTIPANWTFMVYLDADNDLENEGIKDFLEMALVGSTSEINILLEFDRIPGYDSSFGNWNSTKRFRVTKGMTPTDGNALSDLGEINMGNPSNLVDFLEWGIANYPAEKYALILWNHGNGWYRSSSSSPSSLGVSGLTSENLLAAENHEHYLPWVDQPSQEKLSKPLILTDTSANYPVNSSAKFSTKGIVYDDTDNDHFTIQEIDSALDNVTKNKNLSLDLLGFDACLMQMIEVAYEVKDDFKVMSGSEELEPGDGWPYHTILGDLSTNPHWNAWEFGDSIVANYGKHYTTGWITQSVLDNRQFGRVFNAFEDFASELRESLPEYQKAIRDSRNQAQSYDDANFIDLYHFAELIQSQVNQTSLQEKAGLLKLALADFVAAEYHGISRPHSHGLTVYFPSTTSRLTDYKSMQLSADSSWDEFVEEYLCAQDINPSVKILVVDDDAGSSYESEYTKALGSRNYSYWSAGCSSPSVDTLKSYDTVIWFTGDAWSSTLTPTDQVNLASFLNEGGNLFLSGQDIGYDLIGSGKTNAFYANYLRASFVVDDANDDSVLGDSGDAIYEGLVLNLSGGNNNYPSALFAIGSVALFSYAKDGRIAGVKYNGSYNLVYLAFPFESINNETAQVRLMGQVLEFFNSAAASGFNTTILLNLTLSSPKNFTWYNLSSLSIQVNASQNAIWIKESRDKGANVIQCVNCSSYSSAWNEISEGIKWLDVYALSPSGNLTAARAEFYVDRTKPQLLEVGPAFIGSNLSFRVNYSEINPLNLSLYCSFNGTSGSRKNYSYSEMILASGRSSWNHSLNLSDLPDGTVIDYCRILFTDKAGSRDYWSGLHNYVLDQCQPKLVQHNTSCSAIDSFTTWYEDPNRCFQQTGSWADQAPPNSTASCDYCTPQWKEIFLGCRPDETQIGQFNDTYGCFSQTGLYSDSYAFWNNTRPQNQTYGCDYDGDGIIGTIDKVNTSLSNLSFNREEQQVKFLEKGNPLLEFSYNFSSPLDLTGLKIEKQEEGSKYGAMLISGINLDSPEGKTVYLDDLDSASDAICILDQEISSLEEISADCSRSSEVSVICDGTLQSGYSCKDLGDFYQVTGLKHSGVRENSLSLQENPPESSPSGSGSSGGGGGGGGSSGSSKIAAKPVVGTVSTLIKTPSPSLPVKFPAKVLSEPSQALEPEKAGEAGTQQNFPVHEDTSSLSLASLPSPETGDLFSSLITGAAVGLTRYKESYFTYFVLSFFVVVVLAFVYVIFKVHRRKNRKK